MAINGWSSMTSNISLELARLECILGNSKRRTGGETQANSCRCCHNSRGGRCQLALGVTRVREARELDCALRVIAWKAAATIIITESSDANDVVLLHPAIAATTNTRLTNLAYF